MNNLQELKNKLHEHIMCIHVITDEFNKKYPISKEGEGVFHNPLWRHHIQVVSETWAKIKAHPDFQRTNNSPIIN